MSASVMCEKVLAHSQLYDAFLKSSSEAQMNYTCVHYVWELHMHKEKLNDKLCAIFPRLLPLLGSLGLLFAVLLINETDCRRLNYANLPRRWRRKLLVKTEIRKIQ